MGVGFLLWAGAEDGAEPALPKSERSRGDALPLSELAVRRRCAAAGRGGHLAGLRGADVCRLRTSETVGGSGRGVRGGFDNNINGTKGGPAGDGQLARNGQAGGPACFTFLRASPRYIGAFAHTFILIKPSQIAVYPRIRICGWQGARGDQSINDSTSSIFYPTSSQHCFNIVRSKTGLTAFFYFRRIIVLNLSHLVFSDSITSCKEPSYHPKKTSEGPKMSLEIEVAEKQTAVASLDIILVCFEYIFTMHVDPIFMAFDA